jgi:outer membrane protein TolC
MRVNTIAKATLPVVASLIFAGCKLSDPPPFDPDAIARIQRSAAEQVPQRPLQKVPTTFESPMDERGNAAAQRPVRDSRIPVGGYLRMNLQDIIHRAVASNAASRVAGFQAAIDEQRILEAEARFDPTVFANLLVQNQNRPNRGIGDSPGLAGREDFIETLSQVASAGLRQTLTTGGQVEVRYQSTRTEILNQDPLSSPDPGAPFYDNELVAQITQPLLRDFGNDVNQARITIARNDFRISALDWRQELERTLADIEQRYWELWLAQRNVEIGEQFLRDTERTEEILLLRLGQDTSRVQVSQARAQVERADVDLQERRGQVLRLSVDLKRLMNDPDLPVVGPEVIVPADAPSDDAIRTSLADQVETGLQNRYELMQQKLRIENAGTVVEAAQDNLQPQLNLTGQVGVLGVGSDFDRALSRQTNTDIINWAIGLEFEIPIGNRAARAIYHRTLLQRLQAIEEFRGLSDQVASDVKQAHDAVATAWNGIVATRRQVFASEDFLDALRARERAGDPLTPEFVNRILQAQAEVTEARRSEAQAIATYNVALSQLEQAKGTLLRYNQIALREEAAPAAGGGERVRMDLKKPNWRFWRRDGK